MYDDDIFSYLNNNSSSTVTENNTETDTSTGQDTGYSSQTNLNPYSSQGEYDDYSVNPNYTSEQSYNPTYNQTTVEPDQSTKSANTRITMQMPTIKKDETPVVNLVKSRQKIELKGRMKIVLAMFTIILASLVFVTFYNFISANQIRNTFAGKQQEISSLEASISKLYAEYNYLDSDEQIKKLAEKEGYVEITDENTVTVSVGEEHYETTIKDLPSNWFNDVCEFFSRLFG